MDADRKQDEDAKPETERDGRNETGKEKNGNTTQREGALHCEEYIKDMLTFTDGILRFLTITNMRPDAARAFS